MNEYRWLNKASEDFLKKDYLLEGQSLDERVDIICNTAEKILGKKGFASQFKENIQKGWYSLSTPVWANFGTERGLPISCHGCYIPDTTEGILSTLSEIGIQSKYGGGTSAYFGDLRPRGSKISGGGYSGGAVHFMQLFDKVADVISQGSCYIEGTQVLTNNGFKDFRQILKSDKLAELDKYNNISFTDTYELVIQDFDGEIISYSGEKREDSVDIKVTPNHRMVVEKRKVKNKEKFWPEETEIVIAQDLNLHRDNRFILSGRAKNGDGLSFEDRLRIAFQADGIKDGPNRKIRFHFSKNRKIERLIWILKNLNIEYSTYINTDKTLDINFDYIENIKKNTFEEWINLELLSYQWCSEFIEELSHWDGSLRRKGIGYSSCILSNVDIVQCISSMCFKKTRRTQRNASENRKTLYNIGISNVPYRGGDSIVVKKENYQGKVYCAIVPKGRLLIRYNNRVCVCGNTRRGSFAAYLPIEHKDIEEFLTIRSEGSQLQNINFGVCVSNHFMLKMIAGDKKSRQTWAKVLECRSMTGYPYIFFTDTVNGNAPKPYQDKKLKIYASNLCTEITNSCSEDESFVCDLGSMNILHYEEWKDTNAVELKVYFLDAVMTEFINKAKGIKFFERSVRFAERQRAIGIGWLGWHSFLQSKMIPFESIQAKSWNLEIAKNIHDQAFEASAKMAEEYGEPELLKGYGTRHITKLAIAPTKSSSFILGQVSEGIQPDESNYCVKDLAKGKFTVKNPYLLKLLEEKGRNIREVWQSIMKNEGSVQHLDFLSQNERDVFKTFGEISPMEIIIQAAQRQKYIDQSQSLNLKIHKSVNIKERNALILEAWKQGVKTLYYQMSSNSAKDLSKDILTCKSCES